METVLPTLGYWKIRGLAQPIRLLLTYVGEEFKEELYEQGGAPEYSKEVWTSVIPKFEGVLDFPNLPYYLDGDVNITQSDAILKYIARKHQLDGETDKDNIMIDVLLGVAMDFRFGLMMLVYNPNYESLKEDYFKNVTKQLTSYEKKLGDKPWFNGDKISVADFIFYELLDQHRCMKSDIFNDYPTICAFLARFEALPKVKEYLAEDSVRSLPMNNKWATYEGKPSN